MITKDTQLCISIAAKPGNFGTTFFNESFKALSLDYIYKAMRLPPEGDLESVMRAMRALSIKGCSVSMPFKEKVVPLLDVLDPVAQKISAVNTIVNNDGVLKGYNTDYLGVLQNLKNKFDLKKKSVLVCGVGGMAKAVVLALQEVGAQVFVTARNSEKQNAFLKNMSAQSYSWQDLQKAEGFLFVNATSVGMAPEANQSLVGKETLRRFSAVMDVVSQPVETMLIQTAKGLGLPTISGYEIAVEQARCQFEIYTGVSCKTS